MKTLVIGRSKKPRCFKNISTESLPVLWKYNNKAWMTRNILSDWLISLNNKMQKEGGKILLFIDNVKSHPKDLKTDFVKIQFLPPNTTSVLQPLDQGIIRSTKITYRKLLRHIISKGTTCNSAEGIVKSVNALNAVQRIDAALKSVSRECIYQSFKIAEFNVSVDVSSDPSVPDDDINDL